MLEIPSIGAVHIVPVCVGLPSRGLCVIADSRSHGRCEIPAPVERITLQLSTRVSVHGKDNIPDTVENINKTMPRHVV